MPRKTLNSPLTVTAHRPTNGLRYSHPRQPFTVAVLAPHPDDESIFFGLTIMRLRAAGARVVVIVATNGEEGENDTSVRRLEAIVACARLGVPAHDVFFLNYRDSGLARSRANAHPCAFIGADPWEAGWSILRIMRKTDASLLLSDIAHGIYQHPDHVMASYAAEAAGLLANHTGHPITRYECTVDAQYLDLMTADAASTDPSHPVAGAAHANWHNILNNRRSPSVPPDIDALWLPERLGQTPFAGTYLTEHPDVLTLRADPIELLRKMRAIGAHGSQVGAPLNGMAKEWLVPAAPAQRHPFFEALLQLGERRLEPQLATFSGPEATRKPATAHHKSVADSARHGVSVR